MPLVSKRASPRAVQVAIQYRTHDSRYCLQLYQDDLHGLDCMEARLGASRDAGRCNRFVP